MKKISLVVFFTIQLCLHSCLPARISIGNKNNLTSEGTSLFRIEYSDGKYIVQQIVQLLRSARVADLDLPEANSREGRLEARFRALGSDKEQSLKQQLEQIAGVMYVQVIKDGMPTKNPFF